MNDGNIVRNCNRVKDCPINLRVPQDFIFSSKEVTFVKTATEKKLATHIPAIKTPVVITKRLRAEGIKRYFEASPKHLVTMAVGLNDLLQGIDESETMNEKAISAFQTTIYNFVVGVDGQRNQRNGEVRVTEDFRGVRISSSEQPLLRKSNKGGAYKRFIDLHLLEALFSVTEGRELHLFVARCHVHFGRL